MKKYLWCIILILLSSSFGIAQAQCTQTGPNTFNCPVGGGGGSNLGAFMPPMGPGNSQSTSYSTKSYADMQAATQQARKACQAELYKQYSEKCIAEKTKLYYSHINQCNDLAESGTYQMAGGGAGLVLGSLIAASNPVGWVVIGVSVLIGADGAMDQQQGNYRCRDAADKNKVENEAFCESNSTLKASVNCASII